MLWKGRRESGNVEDRRRISGGGLAIGGGVIGVVIYILNILLSGEDPSQTIQLAPPITNNQMSAADEAADDERAKFVTAVLAETEDVWQQIFKEQGLEYTFPTLVLFRDASQSACGNASSAMGPFYCPNDEKVYIDLSFYQELQDRFNAPGDFAMAYVVAHEVGHHIQKLLGTTDKMERLHEQLSEKEYNRYSVMLELQADFYAGVWANHAQKLDTILEKGDIEEALNAANAIGDDMLQKQAQGYVVPDAFTHGTSKQRMYWFKKGFKTGDLNEGDTFHDSDL